MARANIMFPMAGIAHHDEVVDFLVDGSAVGTCVHGETGDLSHERVVAHAAHDGRTRTFGAVGSEERQVLVGFSPEDGGCRAFSNSTRGGGRDITRHRGSDGGRERRMLDPSLRAYSRADEKVIEECYRRPSSSATTMPSPSAIVTPDKLRMNHCREETTVPTDTGRISRIARGTPGSALALRRKQRQDKTFFS